MVLPAILAGASILTSLIGMKLQSEAQDEQARQLKRAAAEGDKAAADELAARDAIIAKIEKEWEMPEFDTSKFTPQEIQYIGDFMPQVAQYIQEQRPELVKGLQAEAEKNYQKQALAQMAQETQGKPVEVQDMIRSKMELAQMQASQAEQSQRQSLLQDMANRGLMGTGQEALIASQGQQQQAQGLRQAALQAGITGAQEQQAAQERENQRKMNAISALGSLSTNARQQELGIEESNVNAINAFNTRASTTLQQHLNSAADIQNQAALRNINAKQNVAAENVGVQNQAAQYNQSRSDKLTQALSDAKNAKLQTVAGLQGNRATTAANQADTTYDRSVKASNQAGNSTLGNVLASAPQIASSAITMGKSMQPTLADQESEYIKGLSPDQQKEYWANKNKKV